MLENFANEFGMAAAAIGIFMAFGYIPQVQKIWKRKSVEDISIATFGIIFAGVVIWFLYGLSINDYPLIVTNSIGIVTVGALIFSYFKFKK